MKPMPTALTLFLLTSPYSVADDVRGDIYCRSGNAPPCQLAWDMTATPRSEYMLERFDLEQSAWKPYTTLPSKQVGIVQDLLPEGSLFRVRGCEDYLRKVSCAASFVVWIPYLASSTEELPDAVPLEPSGHRLKVHKNQSLYAANMDYNVGLLLNVMNAIQPNDVTPMTLPPVRIVEGRIVGGKMVKDNTPDEDILKSMTDEMYLHNEVFGLWERWTGESGAGNQ